ncbi:MAG: hypothetical protein OJF49_002830 [Ktedonobacterales bacterium]|nr:MAG: hypothetical protein OJF49_002830 [Ktedonobacterales bacterium]
MVIIGVSLLTGSSSNVILRLPVNESFCLGAMQPSTTVYHLMLASASRMQNTAGVNGVSGLLVFL